MLISKYYKTTNHDFIDTTELFPHVECYLEENNELIAEQISGEKISLGRILIKSDNYDFVNHEFIKD